MARKKDINGVSDDAQIIGAQWTPKERTHHHVLPYVRDLVTVDEALRLKLIGVRVDMTDKDKRFNADVQSLIIAYEHDPELRVVSGDDHARVRDALSKVLDEGLQSVMDPGKRFLSRGRVTPEGKMLLRALAHQKLREAQQDAEPDA